MSARSIHPYGPLYPAYPNADQYIEPAGQSEGGTRKRQHHPRSWGNSRWGLARACAPATIAAEGREGTAEYTLGYPQPFSRLHDGPKRGFVKWG
jgi:hypothetical protein